jgi:hypothetical protein
VAHAPVVVRREGSTVPRPRRLRTSEQPGRNLYKDFEDELLRVNGTKTLISYNYYDEQTFWSLWNKDTYQAVKQLTDPDNIFRDLYTKTCRAALGLDEQAPGSGTTVH